MQELHLSSTIKVLLILGLLFCGCSNDSNDIQELDLSSLKIQKPDSTYVNEEIGVKFFFENSRYKIVKGYFDCIDDSLRKIDTLEQSIHGCTKRLVVDEDTVKVYFAHTQLGAYKFPIVTLLIKDTKNRMYYMADTTFSIDVKKR